ncbi:unnamed protein product [Mytilus coruscus]|uniref:Uncharacterized protein n=1 Tax=Mytilus coruscus TaxID=42192 RepID=A0A6J8AM33_MYTCO|nr:unnamed protein product [Mytilus coruscus]
MFTPKVPAGLDSKLHRKQDGPFYIVAKGPNHTYKLRRCKNNKLVKSMINANRLKMYTPPDHRPDQNAAPPDDPRVDPRREDQPNFQNPIPPPSQNNDRRTVRFVTVFIWFLLMNILAVSADKEKLVQRTNYGVTFVKEADIVFKSEHWFHTFEISIPHKTRKFSYPSCDIIHQNRFVLNEVISHLTALKTEVASNVNRTVDEIHKLVPKAEFNM